MKRKKTIIHSTRINPFCQTPLAFFLLQCYTGYMQDITHALWKVDVDTFLDICVRNEGKFIKFITDLALDANNFYDSLGIDNRKGISPVPIESINLLNRFLKYKIYCQKVINKNKLNYKPKQDE